MCYTSSAGRPGGLPFRGRGVSLKILVTNDDGIYARGLWTLVAELKRVGRVIVVAPDREQSAVGTSVTLHSPLRAQRIAPLVKGVKAISVEGTPADCVILALGRLIRGGVDLVVSGINAGANLGNDVLISGTVGAAFQGYFRGLPSIALSVTAIEDVHFQAAARLGALLAQALQQGALPRDSFLNVNLPNLPLGEIQGIEVTCLGGRSYKERIKPGYDGKRKYYWIVRGKSEWRMEEGSDVRAVKDKRISLTPLQSDLFCSPQAPALQGLCPRLMEMLTEQPSPSQG